MRGITASKLVLLCLISFTGLLLNAQTITRIEYSIDAFVKQGEGTQLEVSDDASEIDKLLNIDISGLEPGIHVLYIRTMNADGIWSLPTEKSFLVPEKVFPEKIVEFEYSINNYEKPGEGTSLSINTSAGLIDTTYKNIPTDGLAPGSHSIYVRAKNDFGQWSLPVEKSFLINKPDTAKVEKVRYKIYNDIYPGEWKETVLEPAMKQVDSIFPFDTAGLFVGNNYEMEIYAVNNIGVRGYSVNTSIFTLNPNTVPVAKYDTLRYTLPADSMLVIGFDTLISDPDTLLSDILSFSAGNFNSQALNDSVAFADDSLLTIKTSAAHVGVNYFTLYGSDLALAMDSTVFEIVVYENHKPVAFYDTLRIDIPFDSIIHLSVDTLFYDIDTVYGDALTFSLIEIEGKEAESFITFNEPNLVEFMPVDTNFGIHTSKIIAYDFKNLSDTVHLEINVYKTNEGPVAVDFPGIFKQYIDSTYFAVLSEFFSDVDIPYGDSLAYSFYDPNNTNIAEFSYWAEDTLYFKPKEANIGEQVFSIVATDSRGLSDSAEFKLLVERYNSPPITFSDTISISVEADQTVQLMMDTVFTDDDIAFGDSLIYKVLDPQFTNIKSFSEWDSDSVLSISPATSNIGLIKFQIEAMDSKQQKDTVYIELNVLRPNSAPVALQDELAVSVYADSTESIAVNSLFSDVDEMYGDTLRYEIVDLYQTGIESFSSWRNDSTLDIFPLESNIGQHQFYIMAFDINEATDSILINLTVDTISTVNFVSHSLTDDHFTIYPNPANTTLTIAYNGTISDYSLIITDLDGRVVMSEKVNKSEIQINVGNLSSGIYLLKIIENQKFIIRKIIVE